MDNEICLVIDNDVVDRYSQYYFSLHPRAHIPPIKQPYHESLNTWMIMRRAAMNNLKQKWKDFILWFVTEQGYSNLCIDKCELSQTIYYPTNRRHDLDNQTPKFIIDSLVESAMVIDDSSKHICKLTLECGVDRKHPRTELKIKILKE